MIDVKVNDAEIDTRPFTDSDESVGSLSNWRDNFVEGYNQATWARRESAVTGWLHGVGNAYTQQNAATTCNYANTDCYQARIMPTISSVSSSGGYSSGGQVLTISGTSLNFTTTAEIDV
jgi:hypothetical protein